MMPAVTTATKAEVDSMQNQLPAPKVLEESLVVTDFLETTSKEISKQQRNMMFGISLESRFFMRKKKPTENIRRYAFWAASKTRSQVMALVPDTLSAINMHYKAGYSWETAYRKTSELGKVLVDTLEEIKQGMAPALEQKLNIVKWDQIEDMPRYQTNYQVLKLAYLEKGMFYKEIRKMVNFFIKKYPRNLSEADKDGLGYYTIKEMAGLIGGHDYPLSIGKIETADILMYPIMTNLQRMVAGIQKGTLFPDMAQDIDVKVTLGAIAIDVRNNDG